MKDSNRIQREHRPESAEHERFWDRVNAAFDERRDPLDDVDVQRIVAERPEWLDEVQRVRGTIAGLSVTLPAHRAHPRSTAARTLVPTRAASHIGWPLVAAVVVVLATVATMSPTVHDDSATPTSSRKARSVGCVHSFRADVIDEDARGRSVTRFDGERIVRTRETFAAPSIPDDVRVPVFVAIVQSSSAPLRTHASQSPADSTSDRSTTR